MKKSIAILSITAIAVFADSHSFSESSSSSFSSQTKTESFSSSSTNKESSIDKSSLKDTEILFHLGKSDNGIIGSLYIKNKTLVCEFSDKELTKKSNSYVFRDPKSKCVFVIKNSTKSASVDYNKQQCIEAGFCKER